MSGFRNGDALLDLQLLGPPIMTVDGAPLVVDTRKATALLAYLAVTGQPHRRDALAALFWPDADTARAGGALRRTLSALRSAIGTERLHADRATVELEPSGLSVDVAEAHRLLRSTEGHGHPAADTCADCIEPLSRVAELHRGRFLEGFALRDSPGFDDWQFFTADELARELAVSLERLGEALVHAGRVSDAITSARRRLALDPLHEPAHRELMRLYAWNGEQAAALRQYRECVRILERELGVAPLQQTTALYEEVLQQRVAPPTVEKVAVATPASAAAAQLTPFVGRERETAALQADLESVDRDGLLVVVEGEAGIGKTRLVEEVLARTPGRRTLIGRCYEGETSLPYAVIVELLRTALEQLGDGWLDELQPAQLAEVGRLLPDVAGRADVPPLAPLDAAGARARFVDAIGRALVASVAGDRPGMIVVEDLQWADDASLEALTHLAHRLGGRPLALILSWRTELVGRSHPLRRLVAEVRRGSNLVTMTLDRLDEDAVRAALAGLELGDERIIERVAEETEGLPLLLVEYARAFSDGMSALDGTVPIGARDVLLARLDSVGDTAVQVMTAAAVIGRSFELDVLTEASGRSDEEVAAALEELLARRLVVEVLDLRGEAAHVTYDFTHAQLRQLAYSNAALARRRLLHRRVATALESRVRRRGDALAAVIAVHWGAAGEDDKAAAWSVRAGAHARELLATGEAIAHYTTALALGHPEVATIHEQLGDLWTLQGRYADAIASYESAAASATADEAARLEHKLGVAHHRAGLWDLADGHLERALALAAETQPALQVRIVVDRGLNAYRRGDAAGAEAMAEAAATQAATTGDDASAAQAANLRGLLARARGDLAGARQHLERSLEIAGALDDAAAETSALNNLALAVGAAGDTDEALRLADAALKRSAAVGDRHREAALHNNIADLLRANGDTDAAMDHLKQAVAIFAEVGEPGVLSPEIWKLVDW